MKNTFGHALRAICIVPFACLACSSAPDERAELVVVTAEETANAEMVELDLGRAAVYRLDPSRGLLDVDRIEVRTVDEIEVGLREILTPTQLGTMEERPLDLAGTAEYLDDVSTAEPPAKAPQMIKDRCCYEECQWWGCTIVCESLGGDHC